MKKKIVLWVIMVFILSLPVLMAAGETSKGRLFIIGGGSRPVEMMEKFTALAKQSPHKKTVVFPMASGSPHESGKAMQEELSALGLPEVTYHVWDRTKAQDVENVRLLDGVGSIYFTGGDQVLLADALVNTPVHKRLLEIYETGGVIGGTSAGAAVMSELMITGNEKRGEEERAFAKILVDNIEAVDGFGFIKTAIIDQHFVARRRHNRLISLVAEHPRLLGIGIDESTAIIVTGRDVFEVIGSQNVIVYDAHHADIDIQPSGILSGHHFIMHILKAGDKFDLRTRDLVR